ncbi:MAG: hypothetical protein V5A38_05040 [Halolamina sp.]|uniref:DUF7548 family protein n=1 Tax=Halolamina sp. TaxID=1940283 RepID=UPI002FC3C75E
MEFENPSRLAMAAAAVAALLAVVVFTPLVAVSGADSTLGAYYAAGPFGLTAVGLLAAVAVVVFLSVDQPHTDGLMLSGAGLIVAIVTLLLGIAWLVMIDSTVLFSFPAEYAWIENHRWMVLVGTLMLAAVAGLQARAAL